MKSRFWIMAALMGSTLLAQGSGGPGGRGNSGNPPTPLTPGQRATRELQFIASFLGLDAAQTTALLNNTTLTNQLTVEQTTLLANAAAMKPVRSALATQLSGNPAGPVDFTAINNAKSSDLAAREAATNDVLAALGTLSPALTPAQVAKLPGLVGVMANGFAGGFGGFRGMRRN